MTSQLPSKLYFRIGEEIGPPDVSRDVSAVIDETLPAVKPGADLERRYEAILTQEALRDLTRSRADMKNLLRQAKQQLLAFLLRYGKSYAGKTNWTQAHYRWLALPVLSG